MTLLEPTFIEMFSGVGGTREGLRRSGWICVWANDNDRSACKIYHHRFGYKELVEADIKTVKVSSIPDHTLLTAGFPCQAFSVAGKRKGFRDTRGTLFYEICRVAEAKQPPLLLLENVKGLLSHDEGLTFQIILESLEELGYLCEWQVLNSKHFGVPQNRERVFIIGHLRGTGSRQIFPIGEVDSIPSKENRREQEVEEGIQSGIAFTIDARYGALRNSGETYIAQTLEASYSKNKSLTNMLMVHNIYGGFKEGVRVSDKVSPTLRTPKGGGHLPSVVVEHKKITERSGEFGDGFKENEAFCLDSSSGRDQVLHTKNMRIRRLTPVECERLQGFPDGWTRGVSDTQRYKLLGNAVTVNVIEFLGHKLLEGLF